MPLLQKGNHYDTSTCFPASPSLPVLLVRRLALSFGQERPAMSVGQERRLGSGWMKHSSGLQHHRHSISVSNSVGKLASSKPPSTVAQGACLDAHGWEKASIVVPQTGIHQASCRTHPSAASSSGSWREGAAPAPST